MSWVFNILRYYIIHKSFCNGDLTVGKVVLLYVSVYIIFYSNTKCTTWKKKLDNYLDTKTGATGFPMSYLVREWSEPPNAVSLENIVYRRKREVLAMPHMNPYYIQDNNAFWGILKKFIIGRHGW